MKLPHLLISRLFTNDQWKESLWRALNVSTHEVRGPHWSRDSFIWKARISIVSSQLENTGGQQQNTFNSRISVSKKGYFEIKDKLQSWILSAWKLTGLH